MNALWPLAIITFKEGIRNRALYGILILALFMTAANFLISSMIPQDVGKVAVDIGLSSISFSGLLLILFVGINLMAKDLDRRTIYMVLSRPISRGGYILGKFLGICLLILAAVFFLSLFALGSIALLNFIYPIYFARFSWAIVLLAVGFTALMLILLAALSFLFASFTTTSFVTLVLTVASYILGQAIDGVKSLVERADVVGIKVSPLTVKVVKGAYYLFPNFSFFDLKTQAAHGLAVPASYILWVLLYFAIYTALALTLAALIFSRREFP